MMLEKDFYGEIAHEPVPWRQYQLHMPLFYPDIRFMSVSFLAPMDKVRRMLPSKRLNPYRVMPSQTVVTITAYEYRKCDIGPYNEVLIGVPVTIDRQTPMFSGILRKTPENPKVISLHLPVTTEIAREVGAEFAGYPKFVAEIEFVDTVEWLTCELKVDDQKILTMRGKKLEVRSFPRLRVSPITFRRGFILRSELVLSKRQMGSSSRGADVKLELGDHAISDEIRDLGLGKVSGYQYCPQAQGILTPVIESFSG